MQVSAQRLQLPKMRMIHQPPSGQPAVDVLREIEREWAGLKDRIGSLRKGKWRSPWAAAAFPISSRLCGP